MIVQSIQQNLLKGRKWEAHDRTEKSYGGLLWIGKDLPSGSFPRLFWWEIVCRFCKEPAIRILYEI